MTANRIAQTFAACAKEGRAAFVGYLMAADPTPDISLENIKALAAAGADIIELGAPFTDPMADGVAIQKAAQRALAAGGSLAGTLEIARRFRIVNTSTPLIVMGYANPIHRMGFAAFAERAAEAGVDGVITVDLPPEEDGPLRSELARNGLAVIRLATPTTTEARMARVADGVGGLRLLRIGGRGDRRRHRRGIRHCRGRKPGSRGIKTAGRGWIWRPHAGSGRRLRAYCRWGGCGLGAGRRGPCSRGVRPARFLCQ